jgi:hypothetical protein
VYVVTVEKRLLLKKLNDLMALRYVVCSDIWCFWIFYYAPWSNHHAGDRIKRGETSILSLWQTISSTSQWKADLALSSPAVLDAVLCKGTTSTTRITTDITGTTDTTSTGTITTTTISVDGDRGKRDVMRMLWVALVLRGRCMQICVHQICCKVWRRRLV